MSKIYKEICDHPEQAFFFNFDVFKWLYLRLINTKLGDFVNLGVLFLALCINSCSSHNLESYLVLFGWK